jgi:phage-related protein (TIGR01555 family)
MQQNGIDDSVLQACWDAIRNLTSIDQGGATLAQRLAMNVLKVTGLRNMETGKQEAFFRARMKVIASGLSLLNTVLLGEGDEFDVRATPVAGFKDLSQSAKEALSASSGIPLAILFGEAPGGLSTDGESHRRAFNNAVAAFQEEILREPLNRLYAILFNARLGPAKGNEPENWKLEFLPLEELSEIQEAELRLKHAQRDMMYLQWGVLDGPHVAKSRFGETGYSSEILPIEEADIEDKQLANMIKEALKEADASAADQGSNATIEGEKP